MSFSFMQDLQERYQRMNESINENMEPGDSWGHGFADSYKCGPHLSQTEPREGFTKGHEPNRPLLASSKFKTTFPIASTPKASTSCKQSPKILGQLSPSSRQPVLEVPSPRTPFQTPPTRYSHVRSPHEQTERIYALEKANASMSPRLLILEEKCKTQEVATDQLSQELRDSREENRRLKVSAQMAQERCTQLEMQLTNTVQHFSNQQQIREQEIREQHKQALEITRQKAVKEQEEIATIQKEELKHQFTVRHAEELQRHRQKYEKDIASLKMAAEKLEQQIKGMKMERDILTVHIQQKTTELQKQVSELQQELADKCQEIEDVKYEAQNTTRIYLERHSKEQLDKTIKDLKDDHDRETTELVISAQQEQAILREEISEKDAQLEEANERYANRDSREEDLEQIQTLREQVEQLERRASELMVFQEQNKLLAFPRNAYGDASSFSGFPQPGISPYNPNQASGYEAYLHAKEIEIMEKDNKLIELKTRISEYYENIEALENHKQIREDEVNNATAELENVKAKKQQMELAVNSQRQFVQTKKQEFDTAEANHKLKVLTLENQKKELERESNVIKEEMKNAEAIKVAAAQEQNTILEKTHNELKHLEKMKYEQQLDIVKQEEKRQALEEQINGAKQELEPLQAEIESLKDTYDNEMKKYQGDIDEANQTFQGIQAAIQTKRDEMEKYEGDIDKASQKLQGIQAEIQKKTNNLKNQNGQLQRTKQELKKIQDDVKEKTDELKGHNGQLEKTKQELKKVQADIKAKTDEKKTLEEQLEKVKAETTSNNNTHTQEKENQSSENRNSAGRKGNGTNSNGSGETSSDRKG